MSNRSVVDEYARLKVDRAGCIDILIAGGASYKAASELFHTTLAPLTARDRLSALHNAIAKPTIAA